MHSIFLLFLLIVIGYFIWYGLKQPQNNGGVHPAVLQAARGNRALAQRMIEQASLKYPDKSATWRREKVIYDLNRDRGVIKNSSSRGMISARELRESMYVFSQIRGALYSLRSLFRRWR
ncbi:MAG: hypothetical protein QNJ55_19635 [Xenococcus sp. MO_188.B8]|nr:hypothetical protein [Xenococcus sp. MO_188.B8]